MTLVSSPRVVIGSPLFNHAKDFPEAIESVLAQTYTDFALVLVDDGSTDATPEIARGYEALDPRVTYVRNSERLGLVDNARKAFDLARQMYPQAEYFAWASDHDLWHPRWLHALVDVLDQQPDVVLTYPLNRRIGASGEVLARKPWAFDTQGITDTWSRLRLNILHMSAGNMVYGLYRADALARAGVYRRVLVPDRLLMTELAIFGQFKQVPEVLWFRRWYGRIFSLGRQRATFFAGRKPLYMYAPWWVSHGVSLFWTFAVRAEGAPRISKSAGARLALRYLAFSGAFHVWQSLRAMRIRVLERLEVLRPHERRVRMMSREIARRGIGDWTWSHLKPYIGPKVRRRLLSGAKKRVKRVAVAATYRPAVAAISTVRSIPVVRRRVLPSLLRHELDQVPTEPVLSEMKGALEHLQRSSAPIIVGPWISEVGFELLYWIPFLNWVVSTYGLDARRLVAVSRGGARPWYRHLTHEYVDVFDVIGVDEYRRQNEERWADAGNQKQFSMSAMERDLIARTQARLGFGHAEVLHPSVMYRLLRFYWFEKAEAALLTRHTSYRRLETIVDETLARELPAEYVAVRFYFRPSFPDTPDNRRFAARVVAALTRDMPVVLLNTGLALDDHDDCTLPTGSGVFRVDRWMTPENNLTVQTQIIGGARAFVGTYGGLSYLAPLYGVPSTGFYSDPAELIPAHLDAGWRLGRAMGAPLMAVNAGDAGTWRMLLARAAREITVDGALRAV